MKRNRHTLWCKLDKRSRFNLKLHFDKLDAFNYPVKVIKKFKLLDETNFM